MANLVIKKNFVDGDKLFAQQLNNNFETIEKAINDGNKIVWQDGTEVKFKRYVTNDIDSLPVLDGSIIYDTAKGRQYIDYKGQRIQVGSAGREVIIQEAQPTEEDNKIWIDSDVINTMGTEIMNEHSDSKIMGYSANYLNERLTKVSPTEPTTGEEVWIQKSKNLFNILGNYTKSTIVTTDWNITENSITVNASTSSSGSMTYDKTYENAGKYVLSFDNVSGRCRPLLQLFDVNGNNLSDVAFGEWTYNSAAYNAYYIDVDETNVSIPFTLPSNVAYFKLGFVALGYTVKNIQLQVGETATSYEPYVDKKIYTKNGNGAYEEFYDETNLEIYSTSEQRIGTWIDGKDLWKRVYNCGTLTNGGTTTVPTGLSNVNYIDWEGVANAGGGSTGYPYKMATTGENYAAKVEIVGDEIKIQTLTDLSSYTGYVTVLYTKN